MQTFDQSLFFLYEKKFISYEEALKWASNPDEFKLKKIGIQSTKDMSQQEIEKRMSDIGQAEGPESETNSDFEDHHLLDIDNL